MEISPLLVGRLQLEISATLFYAFAVISTGLALYLATCFAGFRFDQTKLDSEIFRVWLRVFALALFSAFAFGLLLLFEISLIWPILIERMGNVFGPLMFFAVVVFVVLKSTVLDVLLFGRQRASIAQYRWAIWSVFLGLVLIVYFVIVFDAWSRLAAGTMMIDGRYRIYNWLEMMMQPSALIQSMEFLFASLYCTAGVMLGFSAWQSKFRQISDIQIFILKQALTWGLIALAVQGCLLWFMYTQNLLPYKLDLNSRYFWVWSSLCSALWLLLAGGLLSIQTSTGGALRARALLVAAAWVGVAVAISGWLLTHASRSEFAVINATKAAELLTNTPLAWLISGLALVLAFAIVVVVGFVRLSSVAMMQGVVPVVKAGAGS